MIALDRLSAPKAAIIVWGDSTTAGATATNAAARVCSQLAVSFTPDRMVVNCGIGGESPMQIVDRLTAIPSEMMGLTHIFNLGRIETGMDDTDYISAVDAAMTFIPHSRRVICTATNGGYVDDYLSTGTKYAERIAVRSHILATYPNNFIDLQQVLLDANDGSANDLADLAEEVVPRSLRNDDIHHTDAAQLLIAQTFRDFVLAKGW